MIKIANPSGLKEIIDWHKKVNKTIENLKKKLDWSLVMLIIKKKVIIFNEKLIKK